MVIVHKNLSNMHTFARVSPEDKQTRVASTILVYHPNQYPHCDNIVTYWEGY